MERAQRRRIRHFDAAIAQTQKPQTSQPAPRNREDLTTLHCECPLPSADLVQAYNTQRARMRHNESIRQETKQHWRNAVNENDILRTACAQ